MRKNKKRIYIDKSIIKNISMDFKEDSYSQRSYGKNNDEIKLYINQVCKSVKEELEQFDNKYKEVHYNMQNSNIIIRNIKILKVKNRKDIINMIKFEINQYIPIDLKDYILKYKILNQLEENLNVQVILVPNYMVDLCKEISNMLNMKPKNLSINFDVLQKIISLDLINEFDGEGIFIEGKPNEFILNIVNNKLIQESYILQKTTQSYQSVAKLIEQFKDIYYYGIEDEFIINHFENTQSFKLLQLKESINILENNKNLEQKSMEYISSIGMII